MRFLKGSMMAAIVAIATICTPAVAENSADLQQRTNRDAQGKIVRGPYQTNKFFDNFFISVDGGINFYSNFDKAPGSLGRQIQPSLDVNVGKWFSPSFGLRLGYSGLYGSNWSSTDAGFVTDEVDGSFRQRFGLAYVHGDVMWNISNTIAGYNAKRVWNFVPFLSAGWAHSYGVGDNNAFGNELAVGVGLLNEIRVAKRVNLTLELKHMFVSDRLSMHRSGIGGWSSATFGVSVDLGKVGFERSSASDSQLDKRIKELESANNELASSNRTLESNNKKLEDSNKALTSDNAQLKTANGALESANKQLASAPKEVNNAPKTIVKNEPIIKNVDLTPCAVFFEIGQVELSNKELTHLDYYMKNVNADQVFTLIGVADNQTGYPQRNQQLMVQRTEYVRNLLITKYNISSDHIVVKSVSSDDVMFSDPELNRAVIIKGGSKN